MQDLSQYVYNSNWNKEQLENDYQNMKDLLLLDYQYSNDHLNLNNQGLEKLFFKL